jgi:hypothetical protein
MTSARTPASAAIQLRGYAGLIWARVYWPVARRPPLLVLFGDCPDELCRRICLHGGVVVLAAAPVTSDADALAAVGWAADHAAELDADPARLQVAGTGRGAALAAEVARRAADDGWPELTLLALEDVPG